MLNFLLAQYVTHGYHDPKNMPKEPFSKKNYEPMGDKEMERMAIRNTILMGGEIC